MPSKLAAWTLVVTRMTIQACVLYAGNGLYSLGVNSTTRRPQVSGMHGLRNAWSCFRTSDPSGGVQHVDAAACVN